jgi:hypothetical protein
VSDDGGNCSVPASAFTGQTSTKTSRSRGFCKACHPGKALRHLTNGGQLVSDRLTRRCSRRAADETLGQSRRSDRARLAAERRSVSQPRRASGMTETDHGYSIFEPIFERSEMMAALVALEHAAITRTKAGARHVLSVPVVRLLGHGLSADTGCRAFCRSEPRAIPRQPCSISPKRRTGWSCGTRTPRFHCEAGSTPQSGDLGR